MAKAQIFSLDIITAISIFILIIISIALVWDYTNEKITMEESRNDMEIIARNALSVLVETEGVPSNWTLYEFNYTNIKSLGLADDFLELNQNKIASLVSANYYTAKTILGILGPNYEFSLDIKIWNQSGYSTNSTIGLSPNATAFEVVSVERFAILDNNWAKAVLRLWKSCRDITC